MLHSGMHRWLILVTCHLLAMHVASSSSPWGGMCSVCVAAHDPLRSWYASMLSRLFRCLRWGVAYITPLLAVERSVYRDVLIVTMLGTVVLPRKAGFPYFPRTCSTRNDVVRLVDCWGGQWWGQLHTSEFSSHRGALKEHMAQPQVVIADGQNCCVLEVYLGCQGTTTIVTVLRGLTVLR